MKFTGTIRDMKLFTSGKALVVLELDSITVPSSGRGERTLRKEQFDYPRVSKCLMPVCGCGMKVKGETVA